MDFAQLCAYEVVGCSGCDPENSREAVGLKSIARIPPDRGHEYDFMERGFLFELDLDPFRLPGGVMPHGAVPDGAGSAAQAGMGELVELGIDLLKSVLQFGKGTVFCDGRGTGGHAREHFHPYNAHYKDRVRFFHKAL
jgi:hypothetical protein